MVGVANLLDEDEPFQTFGDVYNEDTKQVDEGVYYRIDPKNGEPLQAKYRPGGTAAAKLQ